MPVQTHGFVYVPTEPDTALACAAVGARVRNRDRGPPWIVVDHAVTGPIVTAWPGRLFRVIVVDQATTADGAGGLAPDAGYTRAVEVEIAEELSLAMLFGEHGGQVVEVIEFARRLTREDATRLACAVDEHADAAYSTAWNAWLLAEDRGSSAHLGGDHADTLAIPARGRAEAPVHGGFLVIADQLRKRAVMVDGPTAISVDDEGESCLTPPWSDATTALLHAAMALGAPVLVDEGARARLLRAWAVVGGAQPGSAIAECQ